MSKEIATRSTSGLEVYTEPTNCFGAADEIASNDIQVPSIMLMQSGSTIAKDRSNDIKAGDFVNSVTHEVVGHAEGGDLEVVVCDMFKTQVISAVKGNEWISTVPWLPEHESLPYEEVVDGREIRRQKTYNYVCFRPLEVREVLGPDGMEYVASPFIVKFKGMSGKYAKRFNQMLQDMRSFGRPSWATSFLLTSHEDTNDKGTFYVYEMKFGEQTIKEVQLAASNLCKMSQAARKSGLLNVVDEDEELHKVRNHADDLY